MAYKQRGPFGRAWKALRNAAMDLRFGGFLGGTIKTRYEHLGALDVGNADYDDLPILFGAAGIGPDDVIVDVGCGKGRVLNWLLAHHRRNRLVGIELDDEVCRAVARRLRRYGNVSILCGDATKLLPEDATVFFLFNPFQRPVMEAFIDALLALPERPRRIVYYRSKDLDLYRDHPRFDVREVDDERLSHASAIVTVRATRAGS